MVRSICLTLAVIGGLAVTPLAMAAGDHSATAPHTHGDATRGPIRTYRALTADETAIQQVLDTYSRAMSEGSVEVMAQAVIAGDFSTIESGYPNWSWEDFRDSHLLAEFQMFSEVSYKIELIVGELQGELGFAVFSYTASGSFNGKASSISGLGTAVLELTEDGWRIHHMHTSAPRSQLEQLPG